MHAHAREAALAAEAAHLQGKFWEMHDLLYKEQANWSKAADVPSLFHSYAGTLGLDLERFKKDMRKPRGGRAHRCRPQTRLLARRHQHAHSVHEQRPRSHRLQINPAGLDKAIEAAMKEKAKP